MVNAKAVSRHTQGEVGANKKTDSDLPRSCAMFEKNL